MNRVPSKVILETPFETWYGWKPSLRHLHIWGCSVEFQIYNLNIKKLDSITTSGYFIGHPNNSKDYRFYCPSHTPKIVEARNAKFLEDHEVSRTGNTQHEEFEEITESPLKTMELIDIQNNQHDIIEHQPTYQEPHVEDMPHEEPNNIEPIGRESIYRNKEICEK